MEHFIETVDELLEADNTCSICYAEFLDVEDLNIHVSQIHLNENSLNRFCKPCHSIFSDIEDYLIHLRNAHLKDLQWCKHCKRIFFNETDLKEHEFKHGTLGLSCSQCDSKFPTKNELENHEFSIHRDCEGLMLQDYFDLFSSVLNMNVIKFFAVRYTNLEYSCRKCNFSTPDLNKFAEHLKIENKSFACDSCFNVYKTKSSLIMHIKSRKCNIDIELCQKCDKYITTNLKTHMKECVGLKCNICNKMSDSVSSYTDHMVLHKQKVTLSTCKFCLHQFVGKDGLKKHIKRAHKGSFHLYKYRCITCDQLFKHPKLLFAHYFSRHRDMLPYTCKICNQSFKVRRSFTIHIKLKHKSVGFVEFDENYQVFFTDKKSENPFQPRSLVEEISDSEPEVAKEILLQDTGEVSRRRRSIVSKIDLVNDNSDSMNESENKNNLKKIPIKRKRKIKQRAQKIQSSSDSDTPLIVVKRKIKKSFTKKQKKNKFICSKCDKNCYTYQNYHHHLSLHAKDQSKHCIKCNKKFKSKAKLDRHIKKKHSTSKLTETLKQLLERRKQNKVIPQDQRSVAEGIRRTIEKVKLENNDATAKIFSVDDNGLSAKKFIESFIPEDNTKDIKVTNSITLKEVTGCNYTPTIKMTKFSPEPMLFKHRLRMPVKFKQDLTTYKANIKVVHTPISAPFMPTEVTEHRIDYETEVSIEHMDDDEMDMDRDIPEVAEEVLLEDKTYKEVPTHQIILQDLPENCNYRIAHLQDEAPYFKIIKMKDMLAKPEPKEEPSGPVVLPDGTKLVTVNPLAHLLGDKNLNTILKSNKYYTTKPKDIKSAIKKALESPQGGRNRKIKVVI